MEPKETYKRRMRVKLIFNPISGKNKESPVQLMDVIKEMQNWKLAPEPFLIEPGCDLAKIVLDSIEQGIRMFVVCGGDGTVSSVVRAITGKTVTLGIIPTGTRNNIALSLGIPTDIPAAIAILRTGRRLKIDLGMSTCNDIRTPFIEVCSVGLFSKLFSAGDDIQHGKISRIGDFLSTLISTPPSEIHLMLDEKNEIQQQGHVVLITNTPYIGANNQVGPIDSHRDGFLDLLIFADVSKVNLIGHVIKKSSVNEQEDDPRIQHFRVRKVTIETQPSMPIMVDSIDIGEGSVQIEILKKVLTVMTPSNAFVTESGDMLEK